jgi:hypothetical protein
MVKEQSDSIDGTKVVVVLNWAEELKELARRTPTTNTAQR